MNIMCLKLHVIFASDTGDFDDPGAPCDPVLVSLIPRCSFRRFGFGFVSISKVGVPCTGIMMFEPPPKLSARYGTLLFG